MAYPQGMSSRRYRLICPIARALDRVGDRWTLLLIRDLHAGPARFVELQDGLPGLAPNLLTARLQQLQEDGLVDREEPGPGVVRYSLTEVGERTAPILAELAWFGSQFEPDDDLRRPPNMRLVALPLQEALRAVIDERARFRVELRVDHDPLSVVVDGGEVRVRLGTDEEAEVVLQTDYDSLLASGEGRLPLDRFVQRVEIVRGKKAAADVFLRWMAKAFGVA